MSATHSLVCDDCKVRYWAGQSSNKSSHIYSKEKVAEFLFSHVGCRIRFINDMGFDEQSENYEDIETN